MFLLPSDKLGIVALANGDGKYEKLPAMIYRIIEDYFKLPRKESERLSFPGAISKNSSNTARLAISSVEHKSPSTLSLTSFAGSYYDPGYGTLTLCSPTPTPSPECTGVLNAFSSFYDVYNSATPELYSAISSVWISHLRFVHTEGNKFDLDGTFLFPNGYGKDRTPFQTLEDGDPPAAKVEFLVEGERVKGLAMNGLAGQTTERQRTGGSLEETAEVWLNKL